MFSSSIPAGAQLVWGSSPGNLVVGEKFVAPITVGLEDSSGAPISSAHFSATFSIEQGPAAGRILGKATLKQGIATFSRLPVNAAGIYVLQANLAGLSPVSSAPITVRSTTPPSNITWSGPITITQGGTYSGNWQSLNAGTPAVTIATSDPVIITGSNIESMSNLVVTSVSGTDITITNTSGWALNPRKKGQSPGRFLNAQNFANADLEHNTMIGTGGIELGYFQGNSPQQTIRVLYNDALNIDGRFSNGSNGFQAGSSSNNYVQFCQLNNCIGVSGVEIGWNRVINLPGMSRVEDNISIYQSSGTSDSPILIHDNYIQGAYPVVPTGSSYTGGGIMLSDGQTNSASTDPGFVQAYNNIVIGTTNYGMAISSGHDDTIYNNIVVSSGRLPNGARLAAANVGIYVWNSINDPFFGNNQEYGNTVGWMKGDVRNDQWLPNVTPSPNQPADALLPGGAISIAVEQSYFDFWAARLSDAGLTVGSS